FQNARGGQGSKEPRGAKSRRRSRLPRQTDTAIGKIADDVARIIAEVRHDTGDSGFHLVGIVQAAAMETAAGRSSQVRTKTTRARPGSLRKDSNPCRERSDG